MNEEREIGLRCQPPGNIPSIGYEFYTSKGLYGPTYKWRVKEIISQHDVDGMTMMDNFLMKTTWTEVKLKVELLEETKNSEPNESA